MTDAELREWIDEPSRRDEATAVEVTEAFLRRLDGARDRLCATTEIAPELALADARRVDAARRRGERPALGALPIVVKDNVDVAGTATSAGSAALGERAAADAPTVAALREAGAIVLAKANMNELALGATTRNVRFGDCRNPWDRERIPGGSSGGSAVAVAADLCAAALGTDTGGSVRIPSAFAGATGLRPSPGRLSGAGIVETSRSFDTAGPIARSARQVRELMAAMAGDPAPRSPAAVALDGVRIGVVAPRDAATDREIARCLARFAADLEQLGASVTEAAVDAAGFAAAADTCSRLIAVEAHAAHGTLLDRVAPETRERLLLGAAEDAGSVAELRRRAEDWRRAVGELLAGGLDVLLTPTVPVPAPAVAGADAVAATRQLGRFTYPWSLAGLAALSLPCGATADGLPVGAQLAAAAGRDDLLLRIADAYQRETRWHLRRPAEAGPRAVDAPAADAPAAAAPAAAAHGEAA